MRIVTDNLGCIYPLSGYNNVPFSYYLKKARFYDLEKTIIPSKDANYQDHFESYPGLVTETMMDNNVALVSIKGGELPNRLFYKSNLLYDNFVMQGTVDILEGHFAKYNGYGFLTSPKETPGEYIFYTAVNVSSNNGTQYIFTNAGSTKGIGISYNYYLFINNGTESVNSSVYTGYDNKLFCLKYVVTETSASLYYIKERELSLKEMMASEEWQLAVSVNMPSTSGYKRLIGYDNVSAAQVTDAMFSGRIDLSKTIMVGLDNKTLIWGMQKLDKTVAVIPSQYSTSRYIERERFVVKGNPVISNKALSSISRTSYLKTDVDLTLNTTVYMRIKLSSDISTAQGVFTTRSFGCLSVSGGYFQIFNNSVLSIPEAGATYWIKLNISRTNTTVITLGYILDDGTYTKSSIKGATNWTSSQYTQNLQYTGIYYIGIEPYDRYSAFVRPFLGEVYLDDMWVEDNETGEVVWQPYELSQQTVLGALDTGLVDTGARRVYNVFDNGERTILSLDAYKTGYSWIGEVEVPLHTPPFFNSGSATED